MLPKAGVWVGIELPEELLFMLNLHATRPTGWRNSLCKRAFSGLLHIHPDRIAIDLVMLSNGLEGLS